VEHTVEVTASSPPVYFVTRDTDYDRAHLRIFLLLNKSANPAWPTCLLDDAASAKCAPVAPYEWRLIGYFNLDHWHPMDASAQLFKLEGLGKGDDPIADQRPAIDRVMHPDEAAARLEQLCKPGFVPPTPMFPRRRSRPAHSKRGQPP
jgi:hypothetical protein